MNYIVHFDEHLRDGHETYAKLVDTLADAERLINDHVRQNVSVRVFTVGAEVAITRETVSEPQPAKETVKFKLAILRQSDERRAERSSETNAR